MDMAVDLLGQQAGFEQLTLAGGETAGILAAWIAERLGLPMLYIRKKPKGFGRNVRIEVVLAPGQRVLPSRIGNHGGSKLSFTDANREAEGDRPLPGGFPLRQFPQAPNLWPTTGWRCTVCALVDVLAAAERRVAAADITRSACF